MTRNEQDRKKELERLYHQHYGHILELALADRRLLPQDGENIAQSVARHLGSYDGPIETESFKKWLEDGVNGAVQRIGFFYGLQKECRKRVRAGIWSVLGKNLDLKDHSSTAFILRQIENDTFVWAWNHLDSLMLPAEAQPSTRLYSQARFHALTWRKNRLRHKARFDEIDPDLIGTEPFQAVGSDRQYFDPGHDDDEDADDRTVHRPKSLPIPSPSDSVLAMKSGKPMLFCPLCKCLQAISPNPASDPKSVALGCGHERPAALSAVA
jgi:hypothetical protein